MKNKKVERKNLVWHINNNLNKKKGRKIMVLPTNFWLLFSAAMVISSTGFKNDVWFISLGYGFSIAGEGLLLMLLYGKGLMLGTAICCVLLIIYGFRLEVRQNKNYGNDPEYQKYVTTVPVLLPFVPLYSVEKQKWLVA